MWNVPGDLFNTRPVKPYMAIISAEGALVAFSITVLEADLDLTAGLRKRFHPVPVHRQQLPANICVAEIRDVDGDGNKELILGLTDRILRTYRFHHDQCKKFLK